MEISVKQKQPVDKIWKKTFWNLRLLDDNTIFVQGQVSRVVPQVPWNGNILIKVLLISSMMIQNHDVGAGDKKGDMEYVISLDKIMVTEFQDFLVVCFTLGMPGIYGTYKR